MQHTFENVSVYFLLSTVLLWRVWKRSHQEAEKEGKVIGSSEKLKAFIWEIVLTHTRL